MIQDSPHAHSAERINFTQTSSIHGEIKFFAINQGLNKIGCHNYNILSTREYSLIHFFCSCEIETEAENLIYLREENTNIQEQLYERTRIFVSDSLKPQSIKMRWYAPNIGLIKYTDYQNNQWELIKHQINYFKTK